MDKLMTGVWNELTHCVLRSERDGSARPKGCPIDVAGKALESVLPVFPVIEVEDEKGPQGSGSPLPGRVNVKA